MTPPFHLPIAFLESLGEKITAAERRLERPVQGGEVSDGGRYPLMLRADTLPIGIVVQRDDVLRYVNLYGAALLGYERRADAIGQPYERFVHPDELEASRQRRKSLNGGAPDVEPAIVKLLHRDGHPVFAHGVALAAGHERERWVISLFLDVTKYKQAEESLRRAEAQLERHAAALEGEVAKRTEELERANHELRTLQSRLVRSERLGAAEDLASRVVHAVNSPLTALLGTVHMARERLGKADPTLDRVHRLAERIQQVVDNTLNLFREGTLDLGLFDAGELIEDVRTQIAQRAASQGVSVQVELPERAFRVRVDGVLIVSALVALAENGLDAMPEGGTLRLATEEPPGSGVAVFRVEDTGPGLPEDARQRLFEPFVTTKAKGLGMGLAIARGVVLGHRGRIRVDDRAGGGTVFHVEIPADRDSPAPL